MSLTLWLALPSSGVDGFRESASSTTPPFHIKPPYFSYGVLASVTMGTNWTATR